MSRIVRFLCLTIVLGMALMIPVGLGAEACFDCTPEEEQRCEATCRSHSSQCQSFCEPCSTCYCFCGLP